MQSLDLRPHLHAQLRIEVGQGLVEQEQLRIAGQGPAHGHTLALTARELGRTAVEQVLDLQHDRDFLDALLARFRRHLAHLQRKTDVVGHGHGRVERVALEHHGDVALGRRHADHVLAAEQELALAGLFQARNDVEQGGLAATRRTDQDEELTRSHFDVDAFEDFDRLVALAENLADARDVQRRCHDVAYPFTAPAVRPFTKY